MDCQNIALLESLNGQTDSSVLSTWPSNRRLKEKQPLFFSLQWSLSVAYSPILFPAENMAKAYPWLPLVAVPNANRVPNEV